VPAATAALALDFADRALRCWGACPEVADLYRRAAALAEAAGQSFLAGRATERAGAVESLL
jgi:hypothetical protein